MECKNEKQQMLLAEGTAQMRPENVLEVFMSLPGAEIEKCELVNRNFHHIIKTYEKTLPKKRAHPQTLLESLALIVQELAIGRFSEIRMVWLNGVRLICRFLLNFLARPMNQAFWLAEFLLLCALFPVVYCLYRVMNFLERVAGILGPVGILGPLFGQFLALVRQELNVCWGIMTA